MILNTKGGTFEILPLLKRRVHQAASNLEAEGMATSGGKLSEQVMLSAEMARLCIKSWKKKNDEGREVEVLAGLSPAQQRDLLLDIEGAMDLVLEKARKLEESAGKENFKELAKAELGN